MILAPKLIKGDTIGIFSPSYPATAIAPIRTQRAISYLESKGYKILKGKLTGKQDAYRSGSIQERVQELNSLIENPDVKCIMSVIGGMVSNAMLPYINYEQLIKTPKIIVGYSDVTALLFGIYSMTGLVTYYGPSLVGSFGEFPPFNDMTLKYFENIVCKNVSSPHTLPTPIVWTEDHIEWEEQDRGKKEIKNKLVTLHKGKARGRFIGGNLNTMTGIWGSKYMPGIEAGDILMVEDSEKDIALLERTFSLLKINGVFDRIGGLIIGKHELFDDRGTGKKCYDMLL